MEFRYCYFVSKIFVIHDYLYVPKLDGSETIHQISGTTTISNGEMSGGSGYLSTAFDNSNNWELSLKVKQNGNCGFPIFKNGETQRDNNNLILTSNRIYTYVNGVSNYIDLGTVLSQNTFHTVIITKNGSNLTFNIDNSITKTISWSLATTLTELCIGVDSWGGTASIKDIIVKPL